MRRETAHSPYAEAFLILLDRLDVVPLAQQQGGDAEPDDGRVHRNTEAVA